MGIESILTGISNDKFVIYDSLLYVKNNLVLTVLDWVAGGWTQSRCICRFMALRYKLIHIFSETCTLKHGLWM
jgi:hypothetical protein